MVSRASTVLGLIWARGFEIRESLSSIITYLLPAQFVATEKPLAVRSLAIPMPISPIDRMPTVASLAVAIAML